MLPTPAAGSAHGKTIKAAPGHPEGSSTGTNVCFNYSKRVLPLHVAQITHPSGIIHSKGLFHPSQQNEEIQLQPLTGPAYCYL